jgi:CRP-like cAMP-binding protein
MQLNDYDFKALVHCPLFKGESQTDLSKMFSAIPYRIEEYACDSFLVLRGQPCIELIILLEGLAAAQINDFSGKTLKLESFHAPQPMATGALFSESNSYPVSLRAESRVRALILPRQSVFSLLRSNERFLSQYMLDMGTKITFLAEKINLFQFRSLRQKIAGYLLDLRRKQNRLDIRLPYTMETLSEILSVARPSLSRCFSQMIEEGLFVKEESRIRIPDEEKLKKVLEEIGS